MGIIVVDVGTSSLRSILYSDAGVKLYTSQIEYSPTYLENDWVEEDPMCGGDSWEEAEGNLQKKAVEIALEKGGLHAGNINYLIAGDLLDQLIASTFGIMKFQIPLFGVYYILETIYNWNRDKDMAAISLLMTIIIGAISCAVFFS